MRRFFEIALFPIRLAMIILIIGLPWLIWPCLFSWWDVKELSLGRMWDAKKYR